MPARIRDTQPTTATTAWTAVTAGRGTGRRHPAAGRQPAIYGYCPVFALLRRPADREGGAPSAERQSGLRVMNVHGLLLQRHGERHEGRRHDNLVAVDQSNTRWCSDGLEIACDNGDKVRAALALDCCDREAMRHVATTGGITAEGVQDLIAATVEHRYGQVNRVPSRSSG